MNGINDHVIRNSPFVNVKVMKRWKAFILDDEMKRTMSRDSENARSHPIKPVTTSACASREPDAIDDLLERSLLHWCFARLTIPLSCSLWFSTQSHQLQIDFDPDLLLRDLRSGQLLTVRRKMAGSVDLKSLGQFSHNRISVARKALENSSTGEISARPPPPFQDTIEATIRIRNCQSMDSFCYATSDSVLCVLCKHQTEQ